MFAVDQVLISDAVLDAPFACELGRCLGGCCVHGDRGAPLETHELDLLESTLPVVRRRLRPEALETIAREGVWKEEEKGQFGTTTVGGRECVFVRYENRVARCTIQEAFNDGLLDFEKPISCHLYPIRVETYGAGEEAVEVLNYEQVDICKPAIRHGRRTGVQLADYLQKPLTRKYGPGWYRRFRAQVAERYRMLYGEPVAIRSIRETGA